MKDMNMSPFYLPMRKSVYEHIVPTGILWARSRFSCHSLNLTFLSLVFPMWSPVVLSGREPQKRVLGNGKVICALSLFLRLTVHSKKRKDAKKGISMVQRAKAPMISLLSFKA